MEDRTQQLLQGLGRPIPREDLLEDLMLRDQAQQIIDKALRTYPNEIVVLDGKPAIRVVQEGHVVYLF